MWSSCGVGYSEAERVLCDYGKMWTTVLERITADFLPPTPPVSRESCECAGLVKSTMLDFYKPQGGNRWEPSYGEECGNGLVMC